METHLDLTGIIVTMNLIEIVTLPLNEQQDCVDNGFEDSLYGFTWSNQPSLCCNESLRAYQGIFR